MKWYKRFPGDYAAKTAHLSLQERGAYDALLDHYYAHEKPLPADLGTLCRIAGAMSAEEVDAVQRVAEEFFPVNGDGKRHNKRADQELEKAATAAEARAKGGKARAEGMSDEERSEAARRAAAGRWGNR